MDDIVFFQPLNINQLSSIVHLQLRSLEQRLKEQEITLSLTDKAIQSTLKKSYNPSKKFCFFFTFLFIYFLSIKIVYGARPLKRYLEKHITTELSKLLIQMKLTSHCHVTIDTDTNDQFIFQIQQLQKQTSNSPTKPAYSRK